MVMIEKIFRLKENNTDIRTEITAGLTTFMVAAYIIAVNPAILEEAGMDYTAVLLATCITAFIGTVCMSLFANLPFVIASGMGLNAFFAYTVCGAMGYNWRVALFAIFIEGILFAILALTKLRDILFEGIPDSLKSAISAGVGFFVAFIGLQNGGLVVSGSKLVSIVDFNESFHTTGICALLALIGLIITVVLYIKRVPGSLMLGILITWILGIISQATGLYTVDTASGFVSLYPNFALTDFTALSKTLGGCFDIDFSGVGIFNFIVVIFSFLCVDLFDTMGTLIGVSMSTGKHDEDGNLPHARAALTANAIATASGAVLGTSTTTPLVESAAGVGAGGRTGLTSLTCGVLFLLSTLFAPIFSSIPSFATAPALIMVGFLMFRNVVSIKFDEDDLLSAIPAYLCVIAMPLFYSISDGIALGLISYVLIHLLCGRVRKIKPVMVVLMVIFSLKYIFL